MIVLGAVWYCECNGCSFCKGKEKHCTCDVDWDAVRESQMGEDH